MTEKQHLITPPPELVQQWVTEARSENYCSFIEHIAARAAQWGYDQRGEVNESKLQKARDEELEACCEWLHLHGHWGLLVDLRDARRQKPPSLKEQALARTKAILNDPNRVLPAEVRETLELNHRALEALPDE